MQLDDLDVGRLYVLRLKFVLVLVVGAAGSDGRAGHGVDNRNLDDAVVDEPVWEVSGISRADSGRAGWGADAPMGRYLKAKDTTVGAFLEPPGPTTFQVYCACM